MICSLQFPLPHWDEKINSKDLLQIKFSARLFPSLSFPKDSIKTPNYFQILHCDCDLVPTGWPRRRGTITRTICWLILSRNQRDTTAEHTASDRSLLGTALTAHQQAAPTVPRGNCVVLTRDAQRDRSDTNGWHGRWEILSTAGAGRTVTYLTRAWLLPADELQRCTWELCEGMRRNLAAPAPPHNKTIT